MKHFILILILLPISLIAQNIVTSIDDNILWLRADTVFMDIDSTVYEWRDLSSNNTSVFQSDDLNQPIFLDSILNNKPIVRFSGNHWLDGGDICDVSSEGQSVFIVAKSMNSTGTFVAKSLYGAQSKRVACSYVSGDYMFLYQDNSLRNIATPSPLDSFRIFTNISNHTALKNKLWLDATIVDSVDIASYDMNSTYDFVVGAYNNSTGGVPPTAWFLDGDIAEIIVYNRALEETERLTIEHYLRLRYFPSLVQDSVNLGDDINILHGFCDTTLSANEGFSSYLWNTGETSREISVNNSGNYSVTATDIYGIKSIDTVKVIYPSYSPSYDQGICAGDTIKWDLGLDHYYNFEWQDASTDSLIEIYSSGEYSCKITDTNNCTLYTDTINEQADNFPNLVAFAEDTAHICFGNQISINLPPYNPEYTYLWSSNSSDTSIFVNTSGFYFVSITNQNNCKGSDSIYANVLGNAPIADFLMDAVCLGDTTNFSDISFTTDGSSIVNWVWNFGDGGSSSLQNPTHIYNDASTFIVTLSIESDNSCSNIIGKEVLIYNNPVASFSVENFTCINTEINFNNQSTAPLEGSISQWQWNFNDNISSTIFEPTHQYGLAGTYSVSLVAIASNSCTDTAWNEIEVVDQYFSPDHFSPISPKYNELIYDDTIHYKWNSTNYSTMYKVQTSKDESFNNISYTSDYISETDLDLKNTWDTLVFWRVIASNICGDSTISNVYKHRGISGFLQESILWLRADSTNIDNDSTIYEWQDFSGKDISVYQTEESSQPKLQDSVLNYKPCVNFSGNQWLSGGDTCDVSLNGQSIFIVGKSINPTGTFVAKSLYGVSEKRFACTYESSNYTYLYHDNSSKNITIPSLIDSFRIFSNISNHSSLKNKLWIDGNVIDSINITSNYDMNSNYDFIVGAYNNSSGGVPPTAWFLNGDIAEIIIFDYSLSNTKQYEVENYLRHRYFPDTYQSPVNLGTDLKIPYGYCDTAIYAGNQYESYIWNTGETDSAITVNQTGQYAVTVTDIFGFESSDSIMVYYPEVIQLEDSTICYGDVISWNTGLNHHYDFLWQDSSTDSLISIQNVGEYFLKVTDTLGCIMQTDTIEIIVDFFPINTSLGEDDTLCVGSPLALEVGAGEAISYIWNDDSTEDHIIIENEGIYSVTVTNALGCIAEDTINIEIKGIAPIANFTNMAQCLGDMTLFTDLSESLDESNIVDWQWDFGDMNNSNLQSPEHLFADTGLYHVNLYITTDSTCESTITKDIMIYSNPKASFINNGLCSGQLINFINTSTSIMGSIEHIRWDFGNNDTTNEYSTQRQFTEAGPINVQLKVQSLYGCEDQIESIINILAAPIADFNYTALCKNQTIIFYDQSEYPAVYTITSWEWETSTDETADTEQTTFIFDESGAQEVFLKVKALNGCSDTISKSIWIYDQPTALFEAQNVCLNHPIQIENLSIDEQSTFQTYHWWVNQEVVSQDEVPFYLANDTGLHNIKLKVLSNSGCSDTTTGSFVVYPRPYSSFSISENYAIPNQMIYFTADSLNDDFEYEFLFGDAQLQNLSNTAHAYTSVGLFQPQLIVNNQFLCTDSSSKSIQIVQPQVDLAISNVKTTSVDGKTGISVLLSNIGNLEITDIIFRIEMSDQTVFEETFGGSIPIGQSLLYDLHSQFLSPKNSEQYLCLYADVNSLYEDTDLSNNTDCYSDNMDANFIKIYPNPVIDEMTLLYRSDIDTPIEYKVIDGQGKEVIISKIYSEKGLQKYQIPMYNLQEGIYLFKVGNSCVKFVKMN